MRPGVWPLVAVVTSLWIAVALLAQILADPPLDPTITIVAGVLITDVLILGYPSVLRGPRRWRPVLTGATASGGPARQVEVDGNAATRVATAQQTVGLLRPLLAGDAIAITDLERTIAFEGPGSSHHVGGATTEVGGRARAIRTGRTTSVSGRVALGCPDPDCPLTSATFAPLRVQGRVVGAVGIYRRTPDPPDPTVAEAIAGLLSVHLELTEAQAQGRASADARLEALRAQINPHFLFNVLNTIASKARTEPEEARQLLLRLADFFRYAIRQHGHVAEFAQEYFFVRTYVALEQARFGDRLAVNYDIDPQVLSVEIPVLVIQPLVENAIKHGLGAKVGRGTVTLRARVDLLGRVVDIQVRDDGIGMDDLTLRAVRAGHRPGGAVGVGVALANIEERLALLYGDRALLDVRSQPGEGTTARLQIPMR